MSSEGFILCTMGQSVDMPQIPEQMGNAQTPAIKPIEFKENNKQKALFERMNQKIEKYNALVQNPKKNNTDAALLLLQEITYYANYLINHRVEGAAVPSRSWYLTSGIAQQFLRFEKPISHGLAAQAQFYALSHLTDIKLSNFLAEKNDTGSYQVKISDLKSVTRCAKGIDLHRLKRNDVICSATAQYTPPEWDVDYELVECSPLPSRDAHKVGEIYYDKETHRYSVLGHNGEFYEGQSEKLGDRKTKIEAIKDIKPDIYFDMDKFMSYQLGLALYDFLTGLTLTLEGGSKAERNDAREKALEQLQQYKATGKFDYSAAVFQGQEGQVFRELCTALLKTNPKERMSVKEAVAKLNALQMDGPKAEALQYLHEAAYLRSQSRLQNAMERYKTHNEQFNSDPAFLKNYQAMQTFLSEVAEAKTVTLDAGFLAQALGAEASRLETWLQHAAAQPQKAEHFYPHYGKSLLHEGFKAQLLSCDHKLHELSKAEMGNSHAAEKAALVQQITAIRHTLETTMSDFLMVHHNDVVSTPTIEFAKVFETASALTSYVDELKTHIGDLQAGDLQLMQEHLCVQALPMSSEALTQNLRKEAVYLQYHVLYEQKDEKQGIPPYLRTLRQSLIYNFLENNPERMGHLSQDLDHYLTTLFKAENSKELDLISHAQRYQQNISKQEYDKAYIEAREMNKQITALYTKLLGDDNEDPIVAQMTQLRAEMKEAYRGGIVNAQGSAETLHKVNLELVNSLSYLAGPKVSFKSVHTDKDWEQLRAESVNTTSTTKKWAHRVLMGVGVSLALVLVVGTGGVAAAPVLAASIASAVSPPIADSAIGSIRLSSIVARAKTVFSRSKEVKASADNLFNTAVDVAYSLVNPAVKAGGQAVSDNAPVANPNKPVAAPVLSANHSDLFYHGAGGHVAHDEEDRDSDGSKQGHVDPIRK